MICGNHNLRLIRISNEMHGASHAFEYFAWDHEVGEVTIGGYLKGAEDGDVDVSATDHGEGFGAVKGGGAGDHGYSFFTGVYDVAFVG
jgi:hypothetical protein